MLNDVKAFADKFGAFRNTAPGFLPDDQMRNRLNFQMEELLETAHAAGFFFNSSMMEFKPVGSSKLIKAKNLADVLDGLVDQVYVALGTAEAMGFNEAGAITNPGGYDISLDVYKTRFAQAWERVHKANMQKEVVPGVWKVQKPANWKRPDLSDLVQ